MINLENPEINFALDAVRKASLLVKKVQAEMVSSALTKGDRSPVTVADFAAQALVAYMLKATFPNDPLVGEEDAGTLRTAEEAETLARVAHFVATFIPTATSDSVADWIDYGNAEPANRYWTLDPIDGTKGFLRGEQYAVALGLVVDGEVTVGVLGCPNLTAGYKQEIGGPGSLLVAARGQGAYTTPLTGEAEFAQIFTSDQQAPADARFLRSVETGHTNISQLDVVGEHMGVQADPVRIDSQAKYAVLAAGAGDAYFRLINPKQATYKEKVWDQAAGSIVAEEAGGKVTDLDGKPLDFTQGRTLAKNRGVLATNTHLHEAALEGLRAAGA